MSALNGQGEQSRILCMHYVYLKIVLVSEYKFYIVKEYNIVSLTNNFCSSYYFIPFRNYDQILVSIKQFNYRIYKFPEVRGGFKVFFTNITDKTDT